MKHLLAILIVALFVSCVACGPAYAPQGVSAAVPSQPAPSADPINRALDSAIIMFDSDGDLVCAGQRLGPGVLLTAHHCIVAATATKEQQAEMRKVEREGDDALEIELENRYSPASGTLIRYVTYAQWNAADLSDNLVAQVAFVSAKNVPHDLALLTTAPNSQPGVSLRSAAVPLHVGDMVFAIGHPSGLEFTYSRGYVSMLCRWLDGPQCWLQVDIAIWGGNSGGGLFDEDGRLVGVASRRVGSNYGFYTPVAAVYELVASISS